jgi:hypothetical protein
VLVLGDSSSADRQALCTSVEEVSGTALRRAGSIADALRVASQDGWQPDLLVVCQHWSHEYTRHDVATLIQILPLVRIVCCYGPWCGSDGRSGTAWPLAVRVPITQGPARIARELEVIAGRRPPLPLTAARDEIFAFDHLPTTNPPAHAAGPELGLR